MVATADTTRGTCGTSDALSSDAGEAAALVARATRAFFLDGQWPAAAGHWPPSRHCDTAACLASGTPLALALPRSPRGGIVPIKSLLWIGPARGFPAQLAD